MSTIDKINKYNYIFLTTAIILAVVNIYDLVCVFSGLAQVYKLRVLMLVSLILLSACALFEVVLNLIIVIKNHKITKKQIVYLILLCFAVAVSICGFIVYFESLPKYYYGNNKVTMYTVFGLVALAFYYVLKTENKSSVNYIDFYVSLGFGLLFSILSVFYVEKHNVYKFIIVSILALICLIQMFCNVKNKLSMKICKYILETLGVLLFVATNIFAMLNYHVYDIINSTSMILTLAVGFYFVSFLADICKQQHKTSSILNAVALLSCFVIVLIRVYLKGFDLKSNCVTTGIMLGVVALRCLSQVFKYPNKLSYIILGVVGAFLIASTILEILLYDILDLKGFYIPVVVAIFVIYIVRLITQIFAKKNNTTVVDCEQSEINM